MTAQPEVPGAAAVYLFREETSEDDLHMFSIYVRLKVLTEKGKEYSNVELGYASITDGSSSRITDIQGRTIHPDGTIIPFTGKPYDKLIEKTQGVKVMSKVFTLPDVEVGSILEYRYKLRLEDNWFRAPQWYIQSDLYTRKAHYVWKPTNKPLVTSDDRGVLTNAIAWTFILPSGAGLQQNQRPAAGFEADNRYTFELNVHDIPPSPSEDFMPPISSFTYRVLFYYSPYRNVDDYWKNEGKHWAKLHDKFIGPGHAVGAAVQQLTAPTDTQDQKLRKLYAAVMQLENTDFTREHSTAEEKSEGFKEAHTADDIWNRKRGSSDQLTELFVAMARSAGMKAYVMVVTNRDKHTFYPAFQSFSQFDDYLAIVNVDGKEQFFDPGSRFCPYQHLAWKHTDTGGVRQTDGGSEIAESARELITNSRTQRIADLAIDEHGSVTGTIKIHYLGDPALHWRQESLTGDATSLERDIHDSVNHLLPQGMEVKVTSIEKLADYEQPLTVNLAVNGTLGSFTGKRILLPGDVFESNSRNTFPQEKREIPVYFSYPHMMQDAVRVKFPASLNVESLPTSEKIPFEKFAVYSMSTSSTPTSVTVQRNYMLGEIIYMPKEYPELRSFFSKMETKDQESVVLTTAPVTASKPASGGN